MSKRLLALLLVMSPLSLLAQTTAPAAARPDPTVVLHTSLGDITLQLYPDKAPKSVANFMQYVRDGFYSGTVFHRAINGYLVQGGLYTRDLQPKRTRAAVPSEADNGLSNLRGTIAVARGGDPNSGTSQFFVNLVDNRRLDYVGNQSGMTWGYAVFGKVVQGMDVIDKIAALPSRAQGPFASDVPTTLVTIDSANVVGETPANQSTEPTAPPAPVDTMPKAPKKPAPATPKSTGNH
ncbi:MAG: peptidylprolyl isomerase [Dyella sp.]